MSQYSEPGHQGPEKCLPERAPPASPGAASSPPWGWGGCCGGGSALAGRALAAGPDPNIVPVPEGSKMLGAGVNVSPYGKPSMFEKDVVRREVGG